MLFGDVWKRAGLSPRDRSLITVAALVAGYRANELPFHLKRALDNGVSKDELIEAITHLAFYSGWSTANSALPIARRVFQEKPITPLALHQRTRERPQASGRAGAAGSADVAFAR